MWPLSAPGMPPPGPNFLANAKALGDDTIYEKKKGETNFSPGDILRNLYTKALRKPGFTLNVEVSKGIREPVEFIPGHIWGQHADEYAEAAATPGMEAPHVDGPHKADVFLLGKMPWTDEAAAYRNFVGPSGEIMAELIKKLHIKGARNWYITNLVKFMPPTGNTTLKAGWKHDCLPLLHAELRIVRPKYILCIGADASKALLGDKFGVGYMEGRVVQYDYDCRLTSEEDPRMHRAQVMTVLHPAEVARSPDKIRILERGMARFALLTSGVNFDKAEEGLDHRTIDNLEDAESLIEELEAYFAGKKLKRRLVAWDAEWEGQHPQNEGSYLRTIQIAWAPKHAACFKIAHAGGKLAFRDKDGRPAVKRLAKLLNRFMEDKRAVGHFLVSDLEWLNHYGFEPTKHCRIQLDPIYLRKKAKKQVGKHTKRLLGRGNDGLPDRLEPSYYRKLERNARRQYYARNGWERLQAGEGWFDTAMALHAIEETAPLGLESLGMRYTTAPRWDIGMEDWKKAYCKEKDILPGALEGYGNCPDNILIPYANYDADVTLRGAIALMELLDSDYEGNCAWEPFWESMLSQKVILEMHKNGILVDRKRIDVLTAAFMTARAAQEEKIRDYAMWPDFNIRSVQQVKEFLFGTDLNGKVDNTGKHLRIRPKGAKSLRVMPILDTSKPPRRWEDIVARGEQNRASPGTGKLILSILAQENLHVADQINMVRDYRFLDQVLKSVLRPPKEEDDGSWMTDENGFFEYDKGLASCIDIDGRVRTHLYPTAETGRWKSSRPNLQNISKSRDPDYERMLGEEYKHKLRSILMASPGFSLVEFDYKGAELYVMAIMSGDKQMIEHTERANNYPDEGYDQFGNPMPGGKFAHPMYYDIHSNVAVQTFQLKVNNYVNKKIGKPANEVLGLPIGAPCPATKFALAAIGKLHFRTLAKNVIFGIAYGRGAKAIALQAKEQGVAVTPDEAQMVIDSIFDLYPGLRPLFEEAKERALEYKWLCHCFGRYRRFPTAMDYKLEGEFERQAMNFPIQGTVASAVDRGLARLQQCIEEAELEQQIRLLLQIHDAGLVESRYKHIDFLTKELIPYAMQKCVPIYPTKLDGTPTGTGPYYLGIDITVEHHWGEKYTKKECIKLGVPTRFAA